MISKNEFIILSYGTRSGEEVAVITTRETRDVYYFYEVVGKDYKKLGKASSPLDLERKFDIEKRMGIEQ